MGIIDNIKELVSTIQKFDNIDLYQKILQLQHEIQDLVDENIALRKQARETEDLLLLQKQLEFEHNAYWRPLEGGNKEGPFCSHCWDNRKKVIRMHQSGDPDYATCPSCKAEVNVTGQYESTDEQIPPAL